MEIDNTLNANCSELVLKLYPVNSEREFKDLLDELEDLTGWRIGFNMYAEGIKDPENTTDMVRKRLKGDMDRFEVAKPIDKELINFNDDLSPRVKFSDIKEQDDRLSWIKPQYEDLVRFSLMPYDDLKIGNIKSGMSIRMFDGYCDAPGPYVEAFQHCYTPHFEPMAKILDGLESTFHAHDGGSTHEFEKWLDNNGFSYLKNRNENGGYL